jgi:thioredoxin-like negative regulator of GroEL
MLSLSDVSESVKDLMTRAQEALTAKKFSDAESLATLALQQLAGSTHDLLCAQARLLLAETLVKQQKYESALPHLHQVLPFFESDRRSKRHTANATRFWEELPTTRKTIRSRFNTFKTS